ncbi:flagellar hook-length control protein FliK [Litoreibacter ponti]|uniref:Flagellar hook-length control protein FliK n=1 Tax=Litoreibacter ponti TaxID=1510457 RepID=A0A2T6BND9_9RHOB|nr:flagellar hook-length control protein FliK [Litoreibacter ponti]PTX57585.1 flagellar hook-length control protein FliK [Litoreibacter ponti]
MTSILQIFFSNLQNPISNIVSKGEEQLSESIDAKDGTVGRLDAFQEMMDSEFEKTGSESNLPLLLSEDLTEAPHSPKSVLPQLDMVGSINDTDRNSITELQSFVQKGSDSKSAELIANTDSLAARDLVEQKIGFTSDSGPPQIIEGHDEIGESSKVETRIPTQVQVEPADEENRLSTESDGLIYISPIGAVEFVDQPIVTLFGRETPNRETTAENLDLAAGETSPGRFKQEAGIQVDEPSARPVTPLNFLTETLARSTSANQTSIDRDITASVSEAVTRDLLPGQLSPQKVRIEAAQSMPIVPTVPILASAAPISKASSSHLEGPRLSIAEMSANVTSEPTLAKSHSSDIKPAPITLNFATPARATFADVQKVFSSQLDLVEEPDVAFGASYAGSPTATGFQPSIAPQAAGPALPQSIGQQISLALEGSKKNDVEIRLEPEELGKIRIILSNRESGMTVAVFAEKAETLELMRRNSDALAEGMTDAGFDGADLQFGHGKTENQDSAEDTAIGPSDRNLSADDKMPPRNSPIQDGDGLDLRF